MTRIDLKTALIILNEMQELLTDQYSLLSGSNGMSDELNEAIDSLIEITKDISIYTSQVKQ